MDPFHVVALAAGRLDECRRRVQQETTDHRGRKDDPLYKARRTLRTGANLLTDTQATRLQALYTQEANLPVKATWSIYQRLIQAHRADDPAPGFRNLTHYTIRSLIHTGEFRNKLLHP